MNRFLSAFFLSVTILFIASNIFAQAVKISAQIRPRYEYRNGYKTLFPDDANPANFISQRTRLNGFFENQAFRAYISIQNVRVWGDVNQLNTNDFNGLTIHEAWGQVFLGKKVSLKLGRQEIIYDDHRIFGSVDWAQQARSHDAALLFWKPKDNHKIEIGVAYNAMKASLYKEIYTNSNYKAFQLMHYHGDFGKSGLSILFLNNGLAYDADPDSIIYEEKVAYSQTIGGRFTHKGDKIKFNVATYYQAGKNKVNNSLSAVYLAGDVSLHLVKDFSFGLGFEFLSGTASKDKGVIGEKDNSFTPFFGTNHKFNGWMDYFYVGNHGGNVGLVDIYVPLNLKVNKLNFGIIPHYFISAATVSIYEGAGGWRDYSNGLGTEIDFKITYPIVKNVVIAGGYSQMFATKTMHVIKYPDSISGDYNKNTNNWGWVMVTFNPTFFTKE